MNTYIDNRLVAVKKILTANDAEQAKCKSALTVAEFNYYYALGSQLLAEDKLKKVGHDYKQTWEINNQAVFDSNDANNLLISAQQADQKVSSVVTNTATVAQTVQTAANAILKLAASIGSVNNIVSASEYDTDIHKMAQYTNEIMKTTAYQAEQASQLAMEASADASQIISKQVFSEATAIKALFDSMLAKTQADLTTITQTRIVDTDKLIAANTAVNQATGERSVADWVFKAAETAYLISNHDVNHDLTVSVISNTEIRVAFKPFKPPFETMKKGVNISPENYDHTYYLVVVKADAKDSMSYDIIESRFNQYENRFIKVAPNKQSISFQTDVTLEKDIDGNDVKPGVLYVVFIYLVLDVKYKKAINNFSDRISAPSQAFTLTTILSEVQEESGISDNTINFKSVSEQPAVEVEYRCILLLQKTDDDDTETWFNLKIAKQVARVNYTLTCQKFKPYHFSINDSTPDNFGNLLVDGDYVPWILAIVPEDHTEANAYTPSLSKLPAITIKKEPFKVTWLPKKPSKPDAQIVDQHQAGEQNRSHPFIDAGKTGEQSSAHPVDAGKADEQSPAELADKAKPKYPPKPR